MTNLITYATGALSPGPRTEESSGAKLATTFAAVIFLASRCKKYEAPMGPGCDKDARNFCPERERRKERVRKPSEDLKGRVARDDGGTRARGRGPCTRRNKWVPARGEGGPGISRADLPSCDEMADHHRRVIRHIFAQLLLLPTRKPVCQTPLTENVAKCRKHNGRS